MSILNAITEYLRIKNENFTTEILNADSISTLKMKTE